MIRFLRVVLCVALLCSACDESPTGLVPDAPNLAIRAMTVGDWSRFGIAGEYGRQALDEVAALGVNTVVFVATAYQSSRTSSSFHNTTAPTPDLFAFRSAAQYAQSLGLDVVLKVHVDVLDGAWRGTIVPNDPQRWFADYAAYVASCAEAAADVQASAFVVGTELAGVLQHTDQWANVIREARDIYDGEIWYAASWDEAGMVPFWDSVDRIGVNFYFPVTTRPDASRLEMLSGWQYWLDRLERLHERTGKPMIMTEIGYASYDGAGMSPARSPDGEAIDLEEQADLYWAALAALADAKFIEGVVWWTWPVDPVEGEEDAGFSPREKPAADVLQDAWGDHS